MNVKDKKINLIHVVTSLDTGGMENGIINLCNNHNRDLFNLTVCCLRSKGNMASRLLNDVRVVCLNIKEGKPIIEPFKLMLSLIKEPQDIVHTHGYGGGSYIGILGSKIARVPIIINGEHGSFFLKPHQIVIQQITSLMCNVTLAVSENLKAKIIENLSLNTKKIKVIPNGVDTDIFNGKYDKTSIYNEIQNLHKTNIDEKSFVIGCIGSLKPEKNQKMLLNALQLIIKKNNDLNIIALFIGDGPDKDELKQFVINNKLNNNVVFLGIRDDIPKLLSIIDILVSTSISKHEGMSNVILESMSSGVPVISTPSIGSEEIISEGINGYLIKENDIENLSIKILDLINDKSKLKVIGDNARKIVENKYSINKMVYEYERLYVTLLKNKFSNGF